MNKRHYEHTLPNIRGSLSNTYLRSGSRYEISMVEAAGAFATDALVGAVKRGVVGGGAKADLLDILLLGQFRETAV